MALLAGAAMRADSIWLIELQNDDDRSLFSEWFTTYGRARTCCARLNRESGASEWKVVRFVLAPGRVSPSESKESP